MIRMFDGRFRNLDNYQITVDICSDLLKVGGYMTRSALDFRHQEKFINPSCLAFVRADGRRDDVLFGDFNFHLIWKITDEKGLQGKDASQDIEKSGELS